MKPALLWRLFCMGLLLGSAAIGCRSAESSVVPLSASSSYAGDEYAPAVPPVRDVAYPGALDGLPGTSIGNLPTAPPRSYQRPSFAGGGSGSR